MEASQICIEGRNCWRSAPAKRAAFLIDGDAYFSALASTFERARRFILIAGWQLDIRVLVTHLGLHARERRHQVQRLLKILNHNQEIDCTILLGDINEWRPQGFAIRMFNARLGKGIFSRTFPSSYPIFALDRVWVSPRAALVEKTIPHHGLARVASDHLPIRAVIDLGKLTR